MKRWGPVLLAALAVGCKQTTFQQAEPELSVNPTGLAFGAVPVLNSSNLTLTLSDIGQADLSISSITVAPVGGAFALADAGPTTVGGGGQSAPVTVVFTPPAQESYQGTLVIASDDPTNPSLTVDLTGQGSTQCQLTVSPDPLDAGPVGQGDTSLSPLTLTSEGTAPCIISSITLGADTDPAFTFASSTATPATIPNGGADDSATLSLRFSPTAQTPGTATGSVVIVSTDPNNPTLTIPISGERILAPVCELSAPTTVAVGAEVVLDGGASYDPGGNTPLTYGWQLLSKPGGSAAALTDLNGPDPEITVDQPGAYSVQLDVTDSIGIQDLAPCFATITARPADDLYIEMIWDNPPVDVDLHFLAPGGTLNSTATDCNGYNQNPTGFAATCSDAHLTGPGPDWAEDADPASGTYTVDAYYFSSHGVSHPSVNVTVRIYIYGVVAGVFTQQLTKPGQLWQVATIDWPTGTITQIPVPDGGV
jgi:hypothetical protein